MTTSIKLKFVPSKIKDRKGVACLQLIRNRKVKLIRTRFRLFPDEWDRLFDNSDIEPQSYLQSVKTGLDAELKLLVELARLLEAKGSYTVEQLIKLYVSNSFNGYFFPFADYTVKNLKADNRQKTAAVLQTARKSFEDFLCGQDILFDKIDSDLMRKYENHLKHKGVMKNTVSCYMRALRSVYNQAVRRGLTIQRNPFVGVFTRIDKTVKRAVSENIIIRLKNKDLSAHKGLSLARDLFMFSFYMRGISFIDMANLRKNNIKSGYIVYTRSKTRQQLTVKLETCMREIISRYESQTINGYLLPIYTAQNQINTNQLRNYNKRLKRISEMLGLKKSLSSYVARHTWATLALQKGIPIKIISESMGHENETTTRIYLASLGQSAVDKANEKIIRLK
jgi:integrase